MHWQQRMLLTVLVFCSLSLDTSDMRFRTKPEHESPGVYTEWVAASPSESECGVIFYLWQPMLQELGQAYLEARLGGVRGTMRGNSTSRMQCLIVTILWCQQWWLPTLTQTSYLRTQSVRDVVMPQMDVFKQT